MKIAMLMIAVGAMALAPAAAERGNNNTGQGSTNGAGWDHMNGPDSTGQPNVECEDLIEDGEGGVPGQADNGSSAFGGFAHSRYAGEQLQNSRNTASSSQYDTACAHQAPE